MNPEQVVLRTPILPVAVRKFSRNLLPILFVAFFLSACVSFSAAGQPPSGKTIPLGSAGNIGQTFVAQFDGLSAIGLRIAADPSSVGTLKLVLRTSPTDSQNLREAVLPLSAVDDNGYTYFYFLPVPGSNNQNYYFSLRLIGEGQVSVGISEWNTYPNGALYIDNESQDAQLTFRSIYGRKLMALGLMREALNWLVLSLAAVFLFIIPGWAILSWLLPSWDEQVFWAKFGLSAGSSLIVYPLLLLLTNVVHLHLGVIYAWLPPLVGLLLILIRVVRKSIQGNKSFKPSISISAPGIALGFVIVCLVVTRYWIIRAIDVPLWGDSYQHTMMAQLIVDNQGLFTSWQPYADLQSFTYHFGFHSLVAVFSWLTNLPVIESLLYVGQILNILAILALYPLSRRLSENPWAGVFTVLIAGLLFSMPMFYVNWGRYTQLTGLVILPAFTFIAWNLLEKDQFSLPEFLLAVLVAAGLFIAHVRVWLFAITFVITCFFMYFQPKKWGSLLARIAALFAAAMLLVLPWVINIFNGKLPTIAVSQVIALPSKLPGSAVQVNTIGNLLDYLPVWAWILLPIAIGWGLWKREKGVGLVSLWWFLTFLAANPQWLNLPGSGIITSFAVMISLYFPASLILGTASAWIVEAFDNKKVSRRVLRRKFAVSSGILLLVVFVISILGAFWRINDLQFQSHALALRPDVQAADWIKENTPSDAKFLVNSFFAYEDSALVGADGGWWLPLLADRQTSLPPLTYASEKGPRPDYRQWINDLTTMIEEKGINDPSVINELLNRGIDYIYIGQQQGAVNSPQPLLNLADISSSANFTPIYHQDRVWVFRINPV